jgi:serine/threonine protein kinase
MGATRVRDIGVRICDALAAAHAAGVLHRDIKPGNILVNRYGLVGLADFGLAAIMAAEGDQSAAREALTPAYAPPETFRGEEPTVAADIYSVAATLYALLAGRPPRFPADPRSPGIAAIMALHDRPIADVPGAPPELMALLRRGLAADPAARPPTAASLRDALASLSMHPAPPPPQAARQPQPGGVPAGQASVVHPRRRPPVLLSLAVAAGLVLIGGATLVGARVLHGTGAGAAGGTASGSPGARPVSVPASGVFGIPR